MASKLRAARRRHARSKSKGIAPPLVIVAGVAPVDDDEAQAEAERSAVGDLIEALGDRRATEPGLRRYRGNEALFAIVKLEESCINPDLLRHYAHLRARVEVGEELILASAEAYAG